MNEKLAELYMPLAESMACARSRHLPYNVTFEEVRSAAYYGLADAAHRFDPGRGIPFVSYAKIRISGEIGDLFRGVKYDSAEPDDVVGESLNDPVETKDFFDFVKSHLGESEGKMLEMYYVDGRSLKEVGRLNGVSESRACQIFKRCHSRLKRRLERKC